MDYATTSPRIPKDPAVLKILRRSKFTWEKLNRGVSKPGCFPLWAATNGGVTNGGLRGVWPPFLEIGRNRPRSPFFCLFRPFPEGAKSTWEIQKTEEKGLFPQISSDFLKPPSLKPPFAALQPLFLGKVQIVSRTLSGLFLVGALNRPRKRKRTNRENPRTIREQIGKIPEKSGKSQKGQKRTKKEGQVQIGKPPRLKTPRLGALDLLSIVHLLSHSDLLSRRTFCGHHFPGNCWHFSSQFEGSAA